MAIVRQLLLEATHTIVTVAVRVVGMSPMARYRLLQIFNRYLEKGGEESSVDRIFRALSRSEVAEQCVFNSANWTGPFAPPLWQQPLLTLRNPRALAQLRAHHQRFHPQAWVVHNVFPVGSASIYQLALKLKVPIIYYIHNYRPFSVSGALWANGAVTPAGLQRHYWPEIRCGTWQESRFKTLALAATLQLSHLLGWWRSVKAWVAVSEFMRARFIDAGVPSQDIFTLRHSWELLNAKTPNSTDAGYYLFLGRLTDAKGVHVLFRAWEILGHELRATCPRLIIAGNGPLADWTDAAVAHTPFIERVPYVSSRDKANLIQGCRGLIVPSLWWEPLGLVTYEAYDYAKPVLASRSGGLTEVVVDGVTGRLHHPGNHEELASQIMDFESDNELRAELGRQGREWLLANVLDQTEWLRRFRLIVEHVVG